MGWREGASHVAQADIEWLIALTFTSAQQQVERHGVCTARAAVVAHDGTASVIFYRGDSTLEGADDFAGWVERLQARRDAIRAAAILVVRAGEASGGEIRVDLEHVEGVAVRISRTYGRRRRHKGMVFGELYAAPSRRVVWP